MYPLTTVTSLESMDKNNETPHDRNSDRYYPNSSDDRRKPHWFDKWVNPTTVIALIGGIIWGVQLNMAVLQHSSDIGVVKQSNKEIEQMVKVHDNNMVRVSTLLDGVAQRIDRKETQFDEHLKDAEEWKRKILINERAILKDHEKLFNNNGN